MPEIGNYIVCILDSKQEIDSLHIIFDAVDFESRFIAPDQPENSYYQMVEERPCCDGV